MQSNQLLDRLDLKTMLFYTWFGCTSTDWDTLARGIDDFLTDSRIADEMKKLLSIENSPQYWIESNAWPHPNQELITKLSSIIDFYAPDDWPIEVKTFCLAWSIQSLRFNMLQSFAQLKQIKPKLN